MKEIATTFSLTVDEQQISGLWTNVSNSRCTVIFGHGAGASMIHTSLEAIAHEFTVVGISTVRFNFPYMEAGRNRVDSVPVSTATFKLVYDYVSEQCSDSIFLGGHSFGGRMATHAVVEHSLPVRGLILCSFPLHNPKKPSVDRARHFAHISCPILFLIGTRDGMAQPDLIQQLARETNATLKWLDTADHGYKTLKRSRVRADTVFQEIASHSEEFVQKVLNN